jgi:hypothetical protein
MIISNSNATAEEWKEYFPNQSTEISYACTDVVTDPISYVVEPFPRPEYVNMRTRRGGGADTCLSLDFRNQMRSEKEENIANKNRKSQIMH